MQFSVLVQAVNVRVADLRAAAAEELTVITQQKLTQRADLDMERLVFADDRAAEWERVYKVRVVHTTTHKNVL